MTLNENNDSKAYELIVKSLLTTQLTADGLGALEAFHLKKYLGKSGQEHEIDVSFEVNIGKLKLLIAVECKAYSRKVGIDEITTFAYRLRDIGAHKGLFVTTMGFQKGAEKIAKAEGIGLIIVAAGQLSFYFGFTSKIYELWIDQLSIDVDVQNKTLSIIGERLVVPNCFPYVFPLQIQKFSDYNSLRLAFFLTDEVDWSDNEKVTNDDFGISFARFIGNAKWRRKSGYKEIGHSVIIC